MTPQVILLSIGMITITLMMPVFVFLDLKYRKIPVDYFVMLFTINGVVTGYIYWHGYLTLMHLVGSLVISLAIYAAYLLFRSGAFSGADRNILIMIVMFFQFNPFSQLADANYAEFIAFVYQVKFLAYFFMVMCLTPLVVLAYNLIKMNRYPVWEMITKVPRGMPLTVQIAIAYFITLVWGL